MKKNRNKYLVKNTVLLSIGNFASKFISFFLVPLYTNVLSTSEYGTVDLIYTICTLIVPIMTLNISESVMRFLLDKKDTEKIKTISNVSFFLSFLLGIFIIPFLMLFNVFNNYIIFIYLYCIFLAGSQIYLYILKGEEKLGLYTFGNVLNTLLIAILNIFFLVICKQGIKGFLLSYIVSNSIVTLYGFITSKSYRNISLNLDKELYKKMVKYSFVLIPTSFMWWIMNSSDKVMISYIIDSSANGIYAISYKLPTLISTIISVFTQAWLFSAISEKDSSDNEEYTNTVFESLFCFCFFCSFSLLVVSKFFLRYYVSADFYDAWKYMNFLLVGVSFQSLATFVSTSYSVNKDNKGYLFSGLFGAIVNIILNFLLIPFIKIYGAAIATCVSYIFVFVYRIIDTKKYVNINAFEKKYLKSYLLIFLSVISIYIKGITCQIVLLIELFVFILLFRERIKVIINIFKRRLKWKKI